MKVYINSLRTNKLFEGSMECIPRVGETVSFAGEPFNRTVVSVLYRLDRHCVKYAVVEVTG